MDDVKLYLLHCRLDSADSARHPVVDASERPSRLAIGGEVTYLAELLSVKPIGYKGQHVTSDGYLAQFENLFV